LLEDGSPADPAFKVEWQHAVASAVATGGRPSLLPPSE
jgi:hypothetical protein